MKKYIGAHVSASGGVENAPLNAHNIGATASMVCASVDREIYFDIQSALCRIWLHCISNIASR